MARRRRILRASVALVLVAGTGALGACSKDDGGSPEELCRVLGDGRAFTALFEQGFDPTDTQRALAQLESAKGDLAQLRDAAPKDVRDDLEQEQHYIDAVTEVIERVDPDDPAAVVAEINALSKERSAAQVASLELRSFEQLHCDAAASSTTSGTGPSSSGTGGEG